MASLKKVAGFLRNARPLCSGLGGRLRPDWVADLSGIHTIGEIFRQIEEETGKITFLERLRQHLSALLSRIFDTLAHFYDPSPTFRAYLDVIINAFNEFPILKGCER